MDVGLEVGLCCFAVVAVVAFVTAALVAHVTAEPRIGKAEAQIMFTHPGTGAQHQAPSLKDPSSRDLSVVIPAYNEETRLPPMLDEALKYLEARQRRHLSFTYEVLVVDDGSTDKTTEVALAYSSRLGFDKVRVMTLPKNHGKGGAVCLGMFTCRGRHILMADADGATRFADIERVEDALKKLLGKDGELAIACGSRAHLEKESIAKRSYFRTLLMLGFHALVWALCVRGLRDTQCGFKLFTREAAWRTFSRLHVRRWAFDVEMLYIAQRLGIPVAEVPVTWTEIEGSKLVPFWSWLQMGRDLLFISLRYVTGAWSLEPHRKER
uniref:dolichyl-phosphate beta-glucosyltransferase isoform X2 n=1 Tax=Myxine glutinosa TaxID=7769 RepID=UPI00358E2E0B